MSPQGYAWRPRNRCALPASFLNVYSGLEITGLALAGLLIAIAGALLPAGWAAKMSTATALRTE